MATIQATGSEELMGLTVAGDQLPRLSHYSTTPFNQEFVSPIENINFVKPAGGIWLSPLMETQDGTTTSVWADFLASNWGSGLYEKKEILSHQELKLTTEARILRIDSWEDFQLVYSRYGYFSEATVDGSYPYLDFEQLAENFDGIWLTAAGVGATMKEPGSQRPPGFGRLGLYGWDLESVLIFKANSVKKL